MAAVAEQRDRLRLGDQVPEPGLETGRERHTALVSPRHGPDQRLHAVAERRARGHRDALVGQSGPADAPSVPRDADDGVVGDEDVVEEDLVEHGCAGELAQRADVEPLGVHVDDEVGDPGVLGRVGIGTGEADAEVRDLRQRRPHLLTVEHEATFDPLGPGAQRRQVRSRPRLAEELAPVERPEKGGTHPALLLLGRAVRDECRQGPGTHGEMRANHAGGRQLLVDDELLERRRTAAPGSGPVRHDQARLGDGDALGVRGRGRHRCYDVVDLRPQRFGFFGKIRREVPAARLPPPAPPPRPRGSRRRRQRAAADWPWHASGRSARRAPR